MNSRWQRWVEALVEPFGDENLVRDERQLSILCERFLQTQKVSNEVCPLFSTLELN